METQFQTARLHMTPDLQLPLLPTNHVSRDRGFACALQRDAVLPYALNFAAPAIVFFGNNAYLSMFGSQVLIVVIPSVVRRAVRTNPLELFKQEHNLGRTHHSSQ